MWLFNISFIADSELDKQTKEAWLDEIFSPTSMRRTTTKENIKTSKVVITYEDTGARKVRT